MTNTALKVETRHHRSDTRAEREDAVVLHVLSRLGVKVDTYQPANGVYAQPTIRSLGAVATPETVIDRGPSWPGNGVAPNYSEVQH